ncbi:MAG: efflux RND transporter periplasmic adaptor subunit [Steroidobacteraceae bacterium]|jgi:RND family efflux transporter MFP subunit
MRATHWLSLCLIVLALSACGRRAAPESEPVASLTVTTTQLEMRDVEREVIASGSVAAWQEMLLGVELSGLRVAKVLVEPGDRVEAGQALLELDRRTLEVQARQAEANLAQAEASLQLAQAQATRGESLLAQNLISSSNFDELQANRARAEAQRVVAEAERDSARLRLGFATLRAPHAGIIAARAVQPGQIVSTGVELLRLIRDGRLEWRAEIAEADLSRLEVGAPVEVRGLDGQIVNGQIRAVSPSLDPQTRTALIFADLPEPGRLRAGMFAEGRLRVGLARVAVVPRQSVVFRDGFPYVFVLEEGNRVRQQRIEMGASQGEFIEIRAGLDVNAVIVVRGAGFLGDGEFVRLVTDSGA